MVLRKNKIFTSYSLFSRAMYCSGRLNCSIFPDHIVHMCLMVQAYTVHVPKYRFSHQDRHFFFQSKGTDIFLISPLKHI